MIIYAYKPGQLGNILTVWAHLKAFSIEYQVPLWFIPIYPYAPYFHIPTYPLFNNIFTYKFFYYLGRFLNKTNINNKFIQSIYLSWNEYMNINNESIRKKLQQTPIIILQGWQFRCPDLLAKHKTIIQQHLQIKYEYLSDVKKIIEQIKLSYDLIIGIHIRQGDYRTFENGKYFYTLHQYIQIIQYTKDTLFPNKNIFFYLCSNEKQDTQLLKKELSNIPYLLSNYEFIKDLYALTQCHYIIAPPSTFSMLASFLGNLPLYMIETYHTHFNKNDFKIIHVL